MFKRLNQISFLSCALTILFALVTLNNLLNLFYGSITNSDEIEHINASFMVWSGLVPYRDFFEHHNPLLWYIFAPVTALFYENASVYYAARFTAFCANMASWFFVYLICRRFLKSPQAFFTAFILFFFLDGHGIVTLEFRPDVFMYLCFCAGLYFYLAYLQTKQLKDLVTAFILFTFSFLFLQKILLLLTVLGFYTLYLLYKKEFNFRDLCKALLAPLLLTLSFIFYLWHYDMLALYWRLNFALNALLPYYYGFHQAVSNYSSISYYIPLTFFYACVETRPSVIITAAAALLLLRRFCGTKNIFRQCLAVLFAGELLSRFFTFSPYFHYYFLFFVLAFVIIADCFFRKPEKRKKMLFAVFVCLCIIITGCDDFHKFSNRASSLSRGKVELMQFVIDNTSADDTVLNGSNYNFNLFRKNTDWLWFQLNDIGYIYDLNFNNQRYDINSSIAEKKPRIIYLEDYINTVYAYRRQRTLVQYNVDLLHIYSRQPDGRYKVTDLLTSVPEVYAHILDREMIQKYYRPAGKGKFWILKEEYNEK